MTEELNESELGTQEYWDNRYKNEINNFRDNGDVGEVWFGEESIDRICKWIFNCTEITTDSRIIDMGCGNGLFLVQLGQNKFKNLFGVDYSEDAIVLAKEIAEMEGLNISYTVFDILNDNSTETFDVVHDKGTYDAISLSSDAKNNRRIYIDNVDMMLEKNGLFIITSCNWTQKELESQFEPKFRTLSVIPTPQFKFGGQTGKSVTSLVLKKN